MRPILNCPKESFPTGIREYNGSNFLLASEYGWAKDSSLEICDLKLYYPKAGIGWYTKNKTIKRLINNTWGGILNTQNKKNVVIGNTFYVYGLTPEIFMNELLLAY